MVGSKRITVKEAGAILSVTDSQVRHLLSKKMLAGKKIGPVWLVSKASVDKYASTARKPGRKPK